MWWQEAAVAAGCGLALFVVFSTQVPMRLWRYDAFPTVFRLLLAPDPALGRTSSWIAAFGAGVFAAIGQAPVLAVIAHRGDELGLVSRLLLGGELVAAAIWVMLLWRWVRSSNELVDGRPHT